jgi:predicted transposase/invertase (TIGR01784 family)
MISGIDPRVDFAFKKVFGSESSKALTISLINAVLNPPPESRIVGLDLLNPYSEKMALDDKVSILDIKARDPQNRIYNLEMQMVATASLTPRLLYYWSKIYSQQLTEGRNYNVLRPTISICFVNGKMFTDRKDYLTRFRLLDDKARVCLTNHIEFHLIELPKFGKRLEQLSDPLDYWLYFFENGASLDAEALPERLDRPEQRAALGVLNMLVRSDSEREKYEARLRDRLEIETLEELRDEARRDYLTALEQLEEQKRALAEVVNEQGAMQRRIEEAIRKAEAVLQEKEEAIRKSEADRQEKEEAIRKSEADRQEKEEAIRKAEAVRQEKEEAIRKTEAVRQEKEEAIRKAEADRQEKEEAIRKAEADRQEKEEAIRKADEERRGHVEALRQREEEARSLDLALRERDLAARDEATRLREATVTQLKRELAERIRFCLRILKRPAPEFDELLSQGVDELRAEVDRREAELLKRFEIG